MSRRSFDNEKQIDYQDDGRVAAGRNWDTTYIYYIANLLTLAKIRCYSVYMDRGLSDFGQKKKKVVNEIANILITALQKDLFTSDEGQIIAKYVLEKTRSSASEQDLIKFLQDLSEKWPLFQKVSQSNREAIQLDQKLVQSTSQDQEKIETIKKQLNELSSNLN